MSGLEEITKKRNIEAIFSVDEASKVNQKLQVSQVFQAYKARIFGQRPAFSDDCTEVQSKRFDFMTAFAPSQIQKDVVLLQSMHV